MLSAQGAGYTLNGSGDLVRFNDRLWSLNGNNIGDIRAERGTTRGTDLGEDTTTGVRWGRWESGRVNLSSDSVNVSNLNLGPGGMHWIVGDDSYRPALPSTGSASFVLYGSTAPTSNTGAEGVLGSASLTANFDNSTVDASLDLSMPDPSGAGDQQWEANASGLELNRATAGFDGAFDSVTVTTGTSTIQGEGWLSGFFTGDSSGQLNGAGLGYSLSDGVDTTVSGTAAFRLEP